MAYILPGSSRGAITEMIDLLLSRCSRETDHDTKILLATCFGEVGAIGEHYIAETKPASNDSVYTGAWRLEQAPWQSRPARYQLHLVTKDLVFALKAASSASEQHKVVYAIQQLLVLLNQHAPHTTNETVNVERNVMSKGDMSDWLKSKLSEAKVLDTVEPFWSSEFQEVSGERVHAFPVHFSFSHPFRLKATAPDNPPFFLERTRIIRGSQIGVDLWFIDRTKTRIRSGARFFLLAEQLYGQKPVYQFPSSSYRCSCSTAYASVVVRIRKLF
jgi:hypothetical protein